jgi:hypothetical protein
VSHFLTFVIVTSLKDAEDKARELMMPYFDSGALSKCDGFVIGGRYEGQLLGAEPMYNLTPQQFQERYGLDVVKAEDNRCAVSQVAPDLVPYAVVTPDGAWMDCEQKQDDVWRKEVAQILERYREHYVVAIDCHC